VKNLFRLFDRRLCEGGHLAKSGQILDASLISALRQHLLEDEKAAIKEGQDFGKNLPQLFEDQSEVVSCCAEDGFGFVTGTAFQEIPSEMAIIFRVPDDRFDGGSSFQFLFDLAVNPAFLA